jgi:tripeptide aminopeptidase
LNDLPVARDRVAAVFAELAAIPSPSRQEREVADRVAAHLEALGLTVDEDETAAAIGGTCGNLWCRVTGVGETAAILLGAHLDTVVPTMDIEPVLRDGVFSNAKETILGADNKAAVAALLVATERLMKSGDPFPTYDMVFTVAEEVGVLGAKHVAKELLGGRLAAVFDAAGAVGGITVRAPSEQSITATFRGVAAHAGLEPERGRSAIEAAARAIASMRLGRLDDETTANVGTIEGGSALNIVPDLCVVRAECRSHDEAKLAQVAAGIVDALERGAAEVGVDVDIDMVHGYRAFALAPRSPIVRLAKAAMTELGVESRLLASGGGSDANVFNARGLPTVNFDCGMTNVHTPDEHISLDDLERLVRLVEVLVRKAPEYAHDRS